MCQPTTYPKTVELVQHVAQSPPVEVYNNLFCPQCVQRHLTAFAVGVSDFDFILMFGRANVHKGPGQGWSKRRPLGCVNLDSRGPVHATSMISSLPNL